ncbi:hypothetical protein EHS25_004521 [Saitozyma podzolica]|uniref:Endonuclease/exonuclease/phosphatase domain-containing protein n=1 Tax=Saitozyma podzolica TaxID=1890683 RepID=A0A427YUK0_9TREE|nr:hypothetical protein EHS25_004521 [Saitozyma podzolica]
MVTTSRASSPEDELRPRPTASARPHRSAPLEIHFATVNVKFDGDRGKPIPIPEHGAIPPTDRGYWVGTYDQLPWAERRSRLVDALLGTGPLDIVGFQEVYHNQLMDFAQLLGPTYAHVGVGRDDGAKAGEYSCIFYDRTKFEEIKWKTIWLSPTPDVPGSKGWDAENVRIATFLSLRMKVTGEVLYVINTHYDHRGFQARAESSRMIREHAFEWVTGVEEELGLADKHRGPVILMGDLNSHPEMDGYLLLTSPKPLPSGKPSFTFVDSYTHLKARSLQSPDPRQSGPYGPAHTFTDFQPPGCKWTERIDFIMIASPKLPSDDGGSGSAEHGEVGTTDRPVGRGGWEVARYACVDNFVEGDADGY